MSTLPPLPAGFDPEREFPILRHWNFLNHAAVAPISKRAADAIAQYTREAADDAYLTGRWYAQAEEIRGIAAKLIGASSSEIAFVKNTSEGLSFVANGLQWKSGDEVVTAAVEYPANIYPWMDLARRAGIRHVMVPETDGRVPTEAVLAAINSKTRMVSLSHVEYASGYRNDLAAIGRVCRERGILFCVDAIQSIGALPVDVNAMNIDFLSADSHKWMLGPEGSGIFYCRRDLMNQLHPEIGWMNVINAQEYGNYDLTLRDDAKRFECGSYNIPGVLGMGASLKLISEIGITLIAARVHALTHRLCTGLEAKGYSIVSSRIAGEDSGIVAFTSSRHDHKKLSSELLKQKVVVALREGRLRASPHFYNSFDNIDKLLDSLPAH